MWPERSQRSVSTRTSLSESKHAYTDVVQIGEFGIEAVSVEIESILIFARKTVRRKTFQNVPFVAVIVLLLENLTSRSPETDLFCD
jgi:hypothetical protein